MYLEDHLVVITLRIAKISSRSGLGELFSELSLVRKISDISGLDVEDHDGHQDQADLK